MIIKNNWLEDDLQIFLEKKFKHFTPHYFFHGSKENDQFFYVSNFDDNDNLINYLNFKLQNFLQKKLFFHRVYINVQHPNMPGEFHYDGDADITGLYMVCGDGDFEVKNEFRIPFEKNKLIIFNSNLIHKGHAPTKDIRITLAFKIKLNSEDTSNAKKTKK